MFRKVMRGLLLLGVRLPKMDGRLTGKSSVYDLF